MKTTTRKDIDEKRRFARRICPRRVDPRVQVVGAVELILACLREARFEELSGVFEPNEVGHAVLGLLRVASRLNRMQLWQSLSIPRAQKPGVRETVPEHRAVVLEDAREDIRDETITRANVVAAMDALHEVVTSMNTMFAVGRISDPDGLKESWALDRYTCAALLPTFAEQLDKFWAHLRKTGNDSTEM